VAVHRIRRTQADLDRLRERHGLARSATERDDLERQIARLEVKRSVRVDRLAARRVAVHGAATCPTAEEGAEGLAEQAG
jgi:carbonic anhydrase